MLKTFSFACLGVMVAGALGCTADATLPDADPQRAPTAEQLSQGKMFQMEVSREVTAETVIPAIVEGAHAELAAACEAMPGGSIRITNPLASGAFDDVPCAALLSGEATSTTSAALSSTSGEERIGQVQQRWSPVGLACSALVLGATLAWNWPWGEQGCNNPRAENPTACKALTGFGGGGLGLLCAFI